MFASKTQLPGLAQPAAPRGITTRCRWSPLRATGLHLGRGHRNLVAAGLSDGDNGIQGEEFQGVYGSWRVTPKDALEVWSYRVGISVVAAAFAVGTATALAPAGAPWAAGRELGNWVASAGAAGLGTSLVLIHMYIRQLKWLLQGFFIVGVTGGVFLAATHSDSPLPDFVLGHPSAVWLIGPAFAALTGVCFKEGACYGKAEAFALTLLIPALLLGHLSGWLPEPTEHALAVMVAGLLAVFAARKYTQPVKEDIGDGSVFAFNAMSPGEQAAKLRQLRADGEMMR